MTSIFLSHSSKDKFFVRQLAERLNSHGIKVWLDEAELKVGDSLTRRIGQAIDDADFVGVVLSTNSIGSEWVQRELQVALEKEFRNRNVIVLPILLEQVEIPAFLRDKFYADFTSGEKFNASFQRLLKTLGVILEEVEPNPIPPHEHKISETVSSLPPIWQLVTFRDIAIIDLDTKRSYKPESDKLLYNMYLKLSQMPPMEWVQIFEAERRFPIHTMWRRAWIEGQHIVIHCIPEELEKYHLSDLAENVKNSNAKYMQYLTELNRQEFRTVMEGHLDRLNMETLRIRLGFK